MKKFFLVAFFAMALAGSAITATYAAWDCPAGSGCACEIKDAMDNNANAQRVKDRAYSRQIIKQNDNSVGMTCFDHAMALSSRLGQIFSDTYPSGTFGAANTKVFGTTIYSAASGADHVLANDFNNVVAPIAAGHATNFADSLSAFLGATLMGYLNTFLGPINSFISTINGYVSTMNGYISQLNSYMSTLQTVLDLLGASMPAIVPTIVGLINQWWTTIQNFINTAIGAIQKAIKMVIDKIKSYIMSAVSSLLNFADASGPCSRISQLWGQLPSEPLSGFPWPTGFRPIEGGGIEQGTPYTTLASFLAGSVPGAGTDFASELTNATNQPLLQKALNDITGSGVLAAPGNMPSWPITPDLTNMTIAQIISKMAGP